MLWSFGPPAAGKSCMAEQRASELFGREGFVSVDGDEIRDLHPGFQRVTEHGLENQLLHQDAWELLKATGCVESLKKKIFYRAIAERQNISLPDCGLKPERVMEMFQALEEAAAWRFGGVELSRLRATRCMPFAFGRVLRRLRGLEISRL